MYFRDYRPAHTSLDLTGTCQSVTHVADALTVSQVHRLKIRNVELETGTAQIAIVKTQLQEFERTAQELRKMKYEMYRQIWWVDDTLEVLAKYIEPKEPSVCRKLRVAS